jgi:tRNA (guanosine-2'-O-)-methyltransferase
MSDKDEGYASRLTGESQAPLRLRRAERVLRDRTGQMGLLLEEPYDPGNLSATLRTAEALGIQHVHVVRQQPWKLRRKVTQRAERWLTLHRWASIEEALEAIRASGHRVMVASLAPGTRPLDSVSVEGRLVLAFGNESQGVSSTLTRRADGCFWIPTLGFTGSLNLSVSVAVALWELRRRQIAGRGRAGDLPPDELAELRETWYRSLAKGRAYRERDYLSWLGRVEPEEWEGPPPDRRNVEEDDDSSPAGGGTL